MDSGRKVQNNREQSKSFSPKHSRNMSHKEFQTYLAETRNSIERSSSPTPRAMITHFESPPRRKLRQEEDGKLQEIEGK